MKKALVGIGVLCLISAAHGQDFGSPVTKREFSIVLADIEGAMNRGLKLGLPERKSVTDKSPVTRAEVIKEVDRLFEFCRPKFKSTPRPTTYDEALIRKHNSGEQAETLIKLAKWGAIAPAGPIVVGDPGKMSLDEVGDLLGLVINRIARLTHETSIKWSPHLMKG